MLTTIFAIFQANNLLLKQAQADKTEIQSLNDQFKEHITNVEFEIQDKTRDIRSILANINQGIFLIKEDKTIHQDHSRYAAKLFDVEDISHQNYQIIFQHANLNSDQRSQSQSALELILGNDKMIYIANCHLLPKKMAYKDGLGTEEKIVEIDWDPIVNEQDVTKRILVALRDVTQMEKLRYKSQKQEQELEYMKEIIDVPEAKFGQFINLSLKYIDQNIELITRSDALDRIPVKTLFINMHTLKGNTRSFQLKNLAMFFHEIEQSYAEVEKNIALMDREKILQDLHAAKELVELYDQIDKHRLGRRRQLDKVELKIEQGLSTAEKVTDISGRGVGMSAVRQYLNSMGGSISVVLDSSDHQANRQKRKLHFLIEIPSIYFSKIPAAAIHDISSCLIISV
ncbi:MAG: Hpt domain-containing protein [Oligoflexus sp.]